MGVHSTGRARNSTLCRLGIVVLGIAQWANRENLKMIVEGAKSILELLSSKEDSSQPASQTLIR